MGTWVACRQRLQAKPSTGETAEPVAKGLYVCLLYGIKCVLKMPWTHHCAVVYTDKPLGMVYG